MCPNFERLRSYDSLKLWIRGKDYWKYMGWNSKQTHYLINLKSKLKLPVLYTDLCLKQALKNRSLGSSSFVNGMIASAEIILEFVYVNCQLSKFALHYNGLHEMYKVVHRSASTRNTHGNITIWSRAHIDRNFFITKT